MTTTTHETYPSSPAEHAAGVNFETASFVRRFWYWWWIVPRVQYDLADLDYQLYTFEVFHQDWRSKLIHYVTIPAIALVCMVFLAQFQVGSSGWLNGALVYVVLAGLVHFGWCRARGLLVLWGVMLGAFVAMWVVATLWYASVATGGPWYAPTSLGHNPLLWIYAWALLETLSHGFEPIPPAASGSNRFVPRAEFIRRGGAYRLAGLLGVPTTYTFVSFVSNLHLFPTFVLRILASTGHQREHVRAIEALAERQWASGQPEIHRVPAEHEGGAEK